MLSTLVRECRNRITGDSFLISGVSFFVLLFGLVPAHAATAPTTYNAISDLFVRPKPPVPSLGAAGTSIVDPTFGTRILRVTDANSYSTPSSDFSGPSGGMENNWNADSTKFWVTGAEGIILAYAFDAVHFTATPLMDPAHAGQPLQIAMGEPWFSMQDPNLLYGVGADGASFGQYNFASNTYTTLFEFSTAVPGYPTGPNQYTSLVSVDATDTYFCAAFGSVQQAYPYLIVWNRVTGQYTLLDPVHSTVQPYGSSTPQPLSLTLNIGLHQTYIDRTGRYVDLTHGNTYGTNTTYQDYIWDTQTGLVKGLGVAWSGHNAMGFGNFVNQSGSLTIAQDGLAFSLRTLDPTGMDNPTQVSPQLPAPYSYEGDTHPSWSNAQPGANVPFVTSVVRDSDSTFPLRPWQNEIIAVATDGSQKVWRFAHHRSFLNGSTFSYADPRGNVSQDGKYFLFTSNWENTLGMNPATNTPRLDVFIVELNQTAPVPPPPSDTQPPTNVQIYGVQNEATVSGPITFSATASDNVGVVGMWFYLDFLPVSAEIGPPFTFTWDSTQVVDGQHLVSALAIDAAYNTAVSTYSLVFYTKNGVTVAPTLPMPQVNFPSTLPVNGTLTISNYAAYADNNVSFFWTFTPTTSKEHSLGAFGIAGAGASIPFKTRGQNASLTSAALPPGYYQVTVQAVDNPNTSPTATGTLTLVNANFSSIRIYPNPWRKDKNAANPITFDQMPLGATVKIFTVSGHKVKTLTPTINTATWDLTNDSGDKVASGIYVYLITDGQGDKVRGKVGVIR